MPLFFLLCRWMCCLDVVLSGCRVFRWSVYVFLFLLSIINFSISNNSAKFAL